MGTKGRRRGVSPQRPTVADTRKTTAKTTVGALRPQPHGGALRNGGTNAGGPGRPASAIRERLRGSFEQRIIVLEEMASGVTHVAFKEKCPKCGYEGATDVVTPAVDAPDRLRALDIMAKYGLGTTKEISVEDVRGRLEQTYEVLITELAPDLFQLVSDQLREVWR